MKALATLAALLAAPAAIAAPQPSDPAAARIEAYNQAVVAVMKDGPKLGKAGRVARFQPIVVDFYAMPAITAVAVGTRWASTPASERAATVTALTRHSAVSLALNFDRFNGERFTVDPAVKPRGGDRLVRSTIAGSGGATTLIYRMRQAGGAWRIIDVIAEGVSQLAVQRADFASTVAAGGPAVLVKRLDALDAKAITTR